MHDYTNLYASARRDHDAEWTPATVLLRSILKVTAPEEGGTTLLLGVIFLTPRPVYGLLVLMQVSSHCSVYVCYAIMTPCDALHKLFLVAERLSARLLNRLVMIALSISTE